MAMPDVPGFLRVDLVYNDGVSNWGSRFFITDGGGVLSIDNGDCATMAGSIKGVWTDNMAPVVYDEYKLVRVNVVSLESSTAPEGSWVGEEAGGLGGEPLSSNVSADCQLLISSRYRGGHPVMHFPPPDGSTLATLRQYSNDFTTTFNTAANNFLQAVNGLSFETGFPVQWNVLRGYKNGASSADVNPFAVNSVQLRRIVGTMRRRARALR